LRIWLKRALRPLKTLKTTSKSTFKRRRYLSLNHLTIHHQLSGGGVASACDKQTNETQTFSPIAGVRRAIATKLGMLIEEVPSIFAVRKHFSIRSIV